MADRVVKYTFTGSFQNLTAGLTAAGRSVDDFGHKLVALDRNGAKMWAGLDHFGQLGGRIALGVGAGLAASAKAAIDWETAWAGVTKTVDGSVAEMAALEDGLRNLAKTMPSTHAEIAAVAEAAGQLGVAQEDILDFTETMLQLAETTNLTADEAATSIAQMTNVMGTAPGDVDNLGAALVALGNDGASTERDIVQMAQRISAAGAQIGLAESDVLAIANAAASMGIEVEAGGSAVSRIFTEMAKATKQGGADLEQFAQVAGMSAQEFTTAFGEDPAAAFAAFTAGLDAINTSGGDVFTMLENLGLSDIRVQNALLSMASSGDLLTDSLNLGAQAWAENTALTDEYAKRLDTTGADARIAWNNIKDAGIEAGDVLLPMISQVAEGVAGMASAFGSLPGPVKSATTGLAGIVAITGGSLWLGAKVVGGIVDTKRALADLGISADSTAGKLGKFALKTAALVAVTSAVNQLADGLDRIDSNNLDRSLTALSTGNVTDDIDKVIESLKEVSSAANEVDLMEPFTLFGVAGDTTLDKMADNIDQVDQALAGMVESGEQAKAAALFDELARLAGEQGVSAAETAEAFDAYALALQNVAAAASAASSENNTDWLTGLTGALGGTEAATESYTGAVEENAAANESEAKALNKATQAMRDKRDAALSGFDAETRWGQAVAEANERVKAGEKGISRFTEAGRANRAALSELAGAWNNQSKAVKNNQDRYDAARQTFIDTATAMGVPKRAAKALADELLEIPRSTVAKVSTPGAAEGTEQVNRLKNAIHALRDKDVYIRIHRLGAQGIGPVRGDEAVNPRTTAPRTTLPNVAERSAIPDTLTVGRGAVTDKMALYGGMFAKDAFAAVGAAAGSASQGLRGLRMQLREAEKAVERERSARDAMLARRAAVSGAVVGSIQNDLWATSEASGNPWAAGASAGGVMDPFAAVQERIDIGRRMKAAIQTLKQKGIKGAALEEILTNGGLAGAEYMAAQSAEALSGFASDLAMANQLAAEAGQLGAEGVVTNQELKAQTKLAQKANERLDRIEKAIEQLEKTEKAGHAGTQQATQNAQVGWESSLDRRARDGLRRTR